MGKLLFDKCLGPGGIMQVSCHFQLHHHHTNPNRFLPCSSPASEVAVCNATDLSTHVLNWQQMTEGSHDLPRMCMTSRICMGVWQGVHSKRLAKRYCWLQDTMRLLVNHQRQCLPKCDRLVALRGGRIAADGSFS